MPLSERGEGVADAVAVPDPEFSTAGGVGALLPVPVPLLVDVGEGVLEKRVVVAEAVVVLVLDPERERA